MRILFLGTVCGNPDEGMKKVLGHVVNVLSEGYGHSVRIEEPRNALLRSRQIGRWRPDLIHYLAGPTFPGLVTLAMLRRVVGSTRTVVSLIHPNLRAPGRWMLSKCGADVVLASSKGWLDWAHGRKLSTCFVPHGGVNLDCFHPVDEGGKKSLRAKLGLPLSAPMVLHVGHIRRNRNIAVLGEIQRSGVGQVVLLGSTTTRPEPALRTKLEASGCVVRVGYEPNVEKYYQAADVYVFPVLSEGAAIQVPLSVLEACAANLAVVTTAFGGLPDVLSQGNGVQFLDGASVPSIIGAVQKAITERGVNTREKVVGLSWVNLARRLAAVYGAGSPT